MTEQTDNLENEYAVNIETIEQLTKRNCDIVQSLISSFHNVSVGCIVIHKNKKVKVQRVDNMGRWSVYNRTRKPWVYGYIEKKDGSFGLKAQCIYTEWELI